jgi:hypothetical protein
MSVKEITLGSWIWAIPTSKRHYVHIIGPHASSGGIPTLRSLISNETLTHEHGSSTPLDDFETGLINGLLS